MAIGIEDLTAKETIEITDLQEGKMYRGELIIDRENGEMVNMVTLRKINKKKIELSNYFVKSDGSIAKSILFNGYQEFNPEDAGYSRLNKQLKKRTYKK